MSEPLRYVVLRHEGHGEPHFDLMFETETGSKLRTWQASNWPLRRRDKLVALGAHRRDYLDYEGPVSRDRGFVKRVDSGTFVPLENNEETFMFRLNDKVVHFRLRGGEWLVS